MSPAELPTLLTKHGTALLCSAHGGVRAVNAPVIALSPGACVAGRAKIAVAAEQENAAVHRAVHSAQPGDLLVVDSGATRSLAMLGDLVAQCCVNRGIVGAVVRGSVRDVAQLRALGFPVWTTSLNPMPASKVHAGEIDRPVFWDGVSIHPGDWVVADDDGVAIIAHGIAVDAALKGHLLADREATIRERLAAGETTCGILGIEP